MSLGEGRAAGLPSMASSVPPKAGPSRAGLSASFSSGNIKKRKKNDSNSRRSAAGVNRPASPGSIRPGWGPLAHAHPEALLWWESVVYPCPWPPSPLLPWMGGVAQLSAVAHRPPGGTGVRS